MTTQSPSVLVLGIGNLLWADEGFGIRAVETLHRHWQAPPNVSILDGGTQGIYLLEHVRAADILVVFDAVDYGLPPGTLKRVEGDEVPSFLGAKKMSLHQTGFQEVLAMAAMLDEAPAELLLVGVQPVELEDYGGSLRPQVKARIAPAIDLVVAWLAERGVILIRRDTPLAEEDTIASVEMVPGRYEDGRPDAADAFRHGDARVLDSGRWVGPEDFDADMDKLLAAVPGEAG